MFGLCASQTRSIRLDLTIVTLDQLRIFIAVAEREHLTQAAEALHLTPSAVSASIHALETRYDVRLFDRIGRRIELSQAGRIFLVEAQATRQRARLAESALSELGSMRRGTLTVQASHTIAGYWLPPFLVAYKAAFPEIEVVLHVGTSTEVLTAVLNGSADIGFAEGDFEDPTLTFTAVARDSVVVVSALSHRLAKKRKVSSQDLTDASWILSERGSGPRSVFDAALRLREIDPTTLSTILELPTNEALCAAVRSSTHLTVVSEIVARSHFDAGHVSRIAFDIGARSFSLVRHKRRYRTKASEAFEAVIVKRSQADTA